MKIKIVIVKPNEPAKITEIDDSLKSMQKVVGNGPIELFDLYEDQGIVIICNEEGKLRNLDLNRAMFERAGDITTKIIDIIAGPFFVCKLGDDLEGLTDEEAEKWRIIFESIEQFSFDDNGNITVKVM